MYTVMIVDDEIVALIGLKEIIYWEDYGFTVCSCCSSVQEALEKAENCRPDVIFTDIRMATSTGIELIAQIRNGKKLDPEFIIVSAYSDFEVARKAMTYGAAGYLLKPLSVCEVEEALIRLKGILDSKNGRHILSIDLNSPGSIQTAVSTLQDRLLQHESSAVSFCISTALPETEVQPTFIINVQRIPVRFYLLSGSESFLKSLPLKYGFSSVQKAPSGLEEAIREALISHNGRFRYSSEPQIREIEYFIGANYNAKISLAQLAKHFCFSENYLCALFKKYTGHTILEFIRNVRLGNACRLLEQGLSVQEVSNSVGFSDYSYFTQVFRQHIGQTPWSYRKSSQNNAAYCTSG